MENKGSFKPENIEQLLAAKSPDELNETEKAFVLQHFKTWEQVVAFHQLISASRQALDLNQEPDLQPDPAILSRLQQKLTEKKAGNERPKGLLRPLSQVFMYKIPVYQAGIAAAVLLAIFIYTAGLEPVDRSDKSTPAIGRTVAEDSLLIRDFTVTI